MHFTTTDKQSDLQAKCLWDGAESWDGSESCIQSNWCASYDIPREELNFFSPLTRFVQRVYHVLSVFNWRLQPSQWPDSAMVHMFSLVFNSEMKVLMVHVALQSRIPAVTHLISLAVCCSWGLPVAWWRESRNWMSFPRHLQYSWWLSSQRLVCNAKPQQKAAS